MGYSKARSTLDGRLGLLQELIAGRVCHWTTTEGQAHKLAYHIREALYISTLYPKEYPELSQAHKTFVIEVVSPSMVQARIKQAPTEAQVLRGAAPIYGLSTTPSDTLVSPQFSQQVIEYIKATQPSNGKYHWPQAYLSEDDLVEIWRFCISQTPPWIMFESEGALTIQRKTRDLAAFSWTPEDIGREISNEERSLIEGEGTDRVAGAVPPTNSGELRLGDGGVKSGEPDDGDHPDDRQEDGGTGGFYRETRKEEIRGLEDESNGGGFNGTPVDGPSTMEGPTTGSET